jgi:hypothetical protein
VKVEYTVPLPLLGKLAEAFIVKQNEHEADVMLANLKARMEVQVPTLTGVDFAQHSPAARS